MEVKIVSDGMLCKYVECISTINRLNVTLFKLNQLQSDTDTSNKKKKIIKKKIMREI